LPISGASWCAGDERGLPPVTKAVPGRGQNRASLSDSVVISDRRLQREAAKRRQERRSQAIAAASTIIVLGGLATWILTSPGWPEVRELFFNWGVFKEAFPEVLEGFWLDVKLFVIVEIAVLVVGLGIALLRTSRGAALFPLRLLAAVWVDIFRGVPTILLVYLVGFGVPALQLSGLPTDPVVLGGIALGLSYSAYVAEVYRAGIHSVHRGQRDAALAVGLTEAQTMRHVILPQAVRLLPPPLLNDFVSLQKDVALVSILGPLEAFRIAQIFQGQEFNYTPLIAAALLYLAVTVPLARVVDRMGGAHGEVK
jgi:polar amino acid transport system permease protein